MSTPSEDPACTTVLTRSHTIGVMLMAEAGILSLVADGAVLCLLAYKVINNILHPPTKSWKLVKNPLDLYILALICADVIQGLGSATSIKWINDGYVSCSSYCTAQGVLQIIGECASAMMTLAIAIYTFLLIVLRKRLFHKRLWIHGLVICVMWLYGILYSGIATALHDKPQQHIGNTDTPDQFIVPDPYWCWIGAYFRAEQITALYLWFWIAAFASIVLYTPMLFIRFDAERRVNYRFILYPISYTILVLPLSIARWTFFSGKPTDNAASFFAITVFHLTGFVNVVLFLYLRGSVTLLDVGSPAVDELDNENDEKEITSPQTESRRESLVIPTISGGSLPDQ